MSTPDRSTLTHFDHWLDAQVSGMPAPESNAASDSTIDPARSRDARDAARQFHELAARANRTTSDLATQERLDTIWEDIMDAHLSPTAIVSGQTAPEAHGLSHTDTGTGDRSIAPPVPLARFQPIINGVLAAALILALATGLWRAGGSFDLGLGFGGDGNGSPTRLTGLVGQDATSATPEAGPPRAALPTDGTLLIDTGASIVSRPLDGSPETRLEGDDQLGPPRYSRTGVPNVVFSSYDKIARNVRTGEVLETNPYESGIVIGPFWVQYTSQNPAVPVDARIVDLRTTETAGFFDLAGADPVGLGPAWLFEGPASGTLGVGVSDSAKATGPAFTPTMLLIDGDLERTRAVPLWLPDEIDFDGDVLAFSPDGSLVAYLTGTTGSVAIQVETISGEFIQRIPWPGEQPVDRLILTDAGTLLIMAEGAISTVDVRQGANPLPMGAYPDEIRDAVLSPNGSHLLFATFHPLLDPNVAVNTAWHLLDLGTGEVTPIPEATGGARIGLGGAIEAGIVMLSVPIGPLSDGTYRVLFVDVTSGALTTTPPTGVTSGPGSGEPISEDGTVIAAYGSGSPETAPHRIEGGFSSLTLNGSISVFDAVNQSVVTMRMPEIPATTIQPSLIVSPDGKHLVLSVRWTDAEGEHAQSWLTTTDGATGWTVIDGGLVVSWVGE